MSKLLKPDGDRSVSYLYKKALFLMLSFVGLFAVSPSSVALTGPYVQIDTGIIKGQYVGESGGGSGLYAFKGIPYAKPPLGDLRWRPPQVADAWQGVRPATAFGPACIQPEDGIVFVPGPKSEDCLTLNVWSAANPGDKRPVMVWIHGGGYSIGAGSMWPHNGRSFADSGAVLVNFNYRLGPFGFMAHPALSAETLVNTSGNYGLLDQIAALQWVQRNIAAFGGDPDNITIFGESAGGISVATLLVSPMASDLFDRAIMESGVMEITTPLRSANSGGTSGESLGVKIATDLGIANPSGSDAQTAAELRARSAEEVLAAAKPRVGMFGEGNKIYPLIDGHVLPYTFADAVQQGAYNKVRVILGVNGDEGMFYAAKQLYEIDTIPEYLWFVSNLFGNDALRVLEMFPVYSDSGVQRAVADIITVGAFVAPARRTARLLSEQGTDVWMYNFTKVPEDPDWGALGAAHGVEVYYVFKTMAWDVGPDSRDKIVSDTMHATWLNFASNDNPNNVGLPFWYRYFKGSDLHLEYGEQFRTGANLWQAACDLFDEIAAPQ